MENWNDKKPEDIKELFGKFLSAEEARKAAEEIRQGDELFEMNPVPELSESQIADIKARVTKRLSKPERVVFSTSVYKAVAAIAAVLIWGWVAIQFFNRPETGIKAIVAESTHETWSGWDGTEVDTEIVSLDEEIDQIEGSILALRLGEQDSANGTVLADIETEIVEIDNFFWKG